jgi:hypothetical protein
LLRSEKAIVAIATLILLMALINRFYTRGGPYFERPATIVDHVGPDKHKTRDALILLPKVRPLLPRNARVTCFRPDNPDTAPEFFAAVGQLPQQTVLAPSSPLPEYVIAIWRPMQNPAYRLVAEFYEGRLYKAVR